MTVAGHIEHSFMCCLAEERERSDSSIFCVHEFPHGQAIKPPPTFPFL
jgi:hypothetical protein